MGPESRTGSLPIGQLNPSFLDVCPDRLVRDSGRGSTSSEGPTSRRPVSPNVVAVFLTGRADPPGIRHGRSKCPRPRPDRGDRTDADLDVAPNGHGVRSSNAEAAATISESGLSVDPAASVRLSRSSLSHRCRLPNPRLACSRSVWLPSPAAVRCIASRDR